MERRRIVKRQKKDGRSAGEGQIPPAVRNQLARLFGTSRAEAISTSRSTVQWRRTLQAVLTELDRYRRANVRADQFHEISLCAALSSAREALRTEDFWPGYVEGITRFALLLMGDYPDHHSRKTGKRRSDHYDLSRQRTLLYMQDYRQQKRTLFAAWKVFGLPKSFDEVISEFRAQHGYAATDADPSNGLSETMPRHIRPCSDPCHWFFEVQRKVDNQLRSISTRQRLSWIVSESAAQPQLQRKSTVRS